MRVFVSSVFRGLEEYRAKTVDLIRKGGDEAINMEVFTARAGTSLEVCLEEVRNADVVVLAVGPEYGSVDRDSGLSYTHLEYREAVSVGKPVLAFVVNATDGTRSSASELDDFIREVRAARQAPAIGADELPGEVMAALRRYWREHGEPGLHYFQTGDEFFRPLLNASAAFNHTHAIVGREAILGELLSFLGRDGATAAILPGVGGVGKSKILYELSQRAEVRADLPTIRFAAPGDWTRNDLNGLPADPVCVVIDDAHSRADLAHLLMACDRTKNARFILTTRPAGLAAVQAATAFMDDGSVHVMKSVQPLENSTDAISLARAVLGEEHQHVADRLVCVADGNALMITIGAWCVRTKNAEPQLLALSPEQFRRFALDALVRDLPTAAGGEVDPRRLLEIVSGIGPINAADDGMQKGLATWFDLPTSAVVRGIADLEGRGLLLRRGRLLRVTPDVLADHLLYCAAITDRGETTGFIDELRGAFGDTFLSNLLRNAAELEWRCRVQGMNVDVLASLWEEIETTLPDLTDHKRYQLVLMLKPVAGFLPEQTLRIAHWLLDHPDAPVDPEEELWKLDDRLQTPRFIPELLGEIGEHPSYVARCASILIDLALHDTDLDNAASYPVRAHHVLKRLAEYRAYRPFRAQMDVLLAIETAVASLPEEADPAWICETIEPVLGRECEFTRSNPAGITLGAIPLWESYNAIKDLRNKAIDLLDGLARGRAEQTAGEAIRRLTALLSPPPGLYGREIGAEERAVWQREAEEVVGRLIRTSRDAALPGARFASKFHVRRWRTAQWPDLAPAVQAARAQFAAEPDEDLMNTLVGPPEIMAATTRARDERIESELQDQAERMAANLWRRCPSPDELLAEVRRVARDVQPVVGADWVASRRLFAAMARTQPTMAVGLGIALSKEPEYPLALGTAAVMRELRAQGNHNGFETVAVAAAGSPAVEMRREVAGSFRWLLREEDVGPSDLDLVKRFLSDAEPSVACLAASSLFRFRDRLPTEAAAALAEANLGDDPQQLQTAFFCLGDRGLPYETLTASSVKGLLERVATIRSIDRHEYNVVRFLDYAAGAYPVEVVDMLLARIDRAATLDREARREERFEPVPMSVAGTHLPGVKDTTGYMDLLRRVRDRLLHEDYTYHHYIPGLFAMICHDAEAASTLVREWGLSAEPRKVAAAFHLLDRWEHHIVFELHDTVAAVVANAERLGKETHDRVTGAIFGIAISGAYSGSPSQPPPRLVEDQKRAAALARKYASNPPAQQFFKSLEEYAASSIERHLRDFEESWL